MLLPTDFRPRFLAALAVIEGGGVDEEGRIGDSGELGAASTLPTDGDDRRRPDDRCSGCTSVTNFGFFTAAAAGVATDLREARDERSGVLLLLLSPPSSAAAVASRDGAFFLRVLRVDMLVVSQQDATQHLPAN